MRHARYALFLAVFALASLPVYLGTALAEWLAPGAVFAGGRVWAALFTGLARALLGIRVVVEGAPPTGAAVVAAKHQSLFETIALLGVLSAPAVVLKRELLAVPLWRFLGRRNGAIPVARDAGPAAMRTMLARARAATDAGRPVLIFPEGTRVAPGLAPPLKPGATALALLLRLPTVPLALATGAVWPPGAPPRPGVARFRFGEAIPPGLPRATFEARLHAAINALEPAAAVAIAPAPG